MILEVTTISAFAVGCFIGALFGRLVTFAFLSLVFVLSLVIQ